MNYGPMFAFLKSVFEPHSKANRKFRYCVLKQRFVSPAFIVASVVNLVFAGVGTASLVCQRLEWFFPMAFVTTMWFGPTFLVVGAIDIARGGCSWLRCAAVLSSAAAVAFLAVGVWHIVSGGAAN